MEKKQRPVYILGIESSCDDTGAAVLADDKLLANIVANQEIHRKWGGVVPELASRAHQQNIVPVVEAALHEAKISKADLAAIAYTRGPGLPGSLLVGGSFAKGMATALGIPLIGVNHMQAHILAHFIREDRPIPEFPFLCLTVSGGHTQIVRVDGPLDMTILGETQDDSAGEAFDKAAKIMGLPYPGGPIVDQLAQSGDPHRFVFPEPKAEGFNFSFSGLKTSFLYLIKKEEKLDPEFLMKHKEDLAASLQFTIVKILINKLLAASNATGIKRIALSGGVSANSGLRKAIEGLSTEGYETFIPPFAYCTDNAAMIGITGWFAYQKGIRSEITESSQARLPF
jgi:N6-L-threonylcarbamoyladenine synthase